MRTKRRFFLVLFLVLVTGVAVVGPLGAADFVQKCNGPNATTQAGRFTLTPGVNALPAKQVIAVKVSLFSCSPASKTRGAGTLRSEFTPSAAQGCGLLRNRITYKVKAKIIWKNEDTSSMVVNYAMSGKTHVVNVSGKVTSGKFVGRKLTGQYHYTPVASPYPTRVSKACANNIKPNKRGRKSVVSLNFYKTKPFVIA